MNHTPIPWATYPWRGDIVAIIEPATKDHIAHMCGGGPGIAEVEANAEYIVRAVNSHEELVATLQAVAKAVQATAGYIGQDGQLIKRVLAALDKAQAAAKP